MKAKFWVRGWKSNPESYKAGFTIGVQTFTVVRETTKERANWFKDRLKDSFKNLRKK